MADVVEIRTGSRLHLGLLAHGVTDGPNYGGCGLTIDEPGYRVRVERATEDDVGITPNIETADEFGGLVQRVRDRVRSSTGATTSITIHVDRVVPRHAGLGSGTQLAAAVAQAMAMLDGETERLPADVLAERTGRGHRSAVGLHGFVRGGFLVDRGHRPGEPLGQLAERVDFPAEWRVVLVMPRTGTGLANEAESDAFERLPATSPEHVESLWRLLQERMIPALRERDFGAFSRVVLEYGQRVGESFAPVQGGIYSHTSTAKVIAALRKAGVEGVGQTSWGPTVFAFTEDIESAERIVAGLREDATHDAEARVTTARRAGAEILVDGRPV